MIKVYNRNSNKYDIENVAGANYIKWCYESPVGKGFTELFIKKKLFSKAYGKYCDTKLSKNKIHSFVKNFNIDMSICKNDIKEFKTNTLGLSTVIKRLKLYSNTDIIIESEENIGTKIILKLPINKNRG